MQRYLKGGQADRVNGAQGGHQGESRVGGRESRVFFLRSLGGGRDMGIVGDCT